MEEHTSAIARVTLHTQVGLAMAAQDYLRAGLDLLRGRLISARTLPNGQTTTVMAAPPVQATVGTLCIAVELMLKARVAAVGLQLLYTDLPLDLHVVLANPASATVTALPPAQTERLLERRMNKSTDLGSCLAIWESCRGTCTALPKSFGKRLTLLRNQSVHGILPSMDHYELSRIAFTAVDLYRGLSEQGLAGFSMGFLEKADLKVLDDFPTERLERLHRKMESARNEAARLKEPIANTDTLEWSEFTVTCPVCGSDAILSGETEPDEGSLSDTEMDMGIDPPVEGLWFVAEAFECPGCKLTLDDPEELELADVAGGYDRSDEVNDWVRDFRRDYVDYPDEDYYR